MAISRKILFSCKLIIIHIINSTKGNFDICLTDDNVKMIPVILEHCKTSATLGKLPQLILGEI